MENREELTFRPYIPYTLFLPNPARVIRADLDSLTVEGTTGVVLQIGLPTSSVQTASGIGNTLAKFFFNRGSLLVVDKGGKEHLLSRVPDIRGITEALTGKHKGLVKAREERIEKEARCQKLDSLTEDDLAECVLYYPHIPNTVDRFLQGREPQKYHEGAFSFLVRERDGVEEGGVIATYGDFKLTAPFPGRVEFLGSQTPGKCDWPRLMDYASTAPPNESPADCELREANYGSIAFPNDTQPDKAFAFALRPLADPKLVGKIGYYGCSKVRTAFDRGNVWTNMKKKRGYTLYSVIDMAVCNIKSPGSGIPIPDSLVNEEDFSDKLLPYWDMINSANATICYIENSR